MEKNKELEAAFQQAFKNYKQTGKKEYWDEMFIRVQNACNAKLATQLKGIYREDFEELVLDATITLMNQLKKKLKEEPDFQIKSLISYVSLPTYYTLYNPKQQMIDKTITEADLGLYNEIENCRYFIGGIDEEVFAEEW